MVVVVSKSNNKSECDIMTREQFIEKFGAIKEHFEQSEAIGKMLHKYLFEGYSVIKFGGELQKHYIELLAELSGISSEMISALLYEGPSMHYYGEETNSHHAVEMNVVTAEDLWDFCQLCAEYDASNYALTDCF